jgi:hypothetical protein
MSGHKGDALLPAGNTHTHIHGEGYRDTYPHISSWSCHCSRCCTQVGTCEPPQPHHAMTICCTAYLTMHHTRQQHMYCTGKAIYVHSW